MKNAEQNLSNSNNTNRLFSNIISNRFVKEVLIILIGVLIVWITFQTIFGTYNPFYVVSSGSMIPAIQIFDILVVQSNYDFNAIDVGDIIVFSRPINHDKVIVHRVDAIIDQEHSVIRTKGDANLAPIPGTDFPITENEYIGKVMYVVPYIGYFIRFLAPPVNYVVIVVVISIMIYKQISKHRVISSSKS